MAVVRDKLDRKLTTRQFMEKYGIKERITSKDLGRLVEEENE
jgi:hypothetical protein